MVKKLTSLFQAREWKLLLKAVVLTFALFAAYRFDFSFLIIAFYFLICLAVYFSLGSERYLVRNSFWLLIILGAIFLGSGSPQGLTYIFFLILALMLFFLFGIVSFIFKDRFLIYGIWNTVFILLIFINWFYYAGAEILWWSSPILFLILIFIFNECFGFYGVSQPKRRLLGSLALAFIALEIAFLVRFLPLGVINGAAFLALFLLLARDILLFHFQGLMNVPFVFRELTFFVFLSILIFAASKWSI